MPSSPGCRLRQPEARGYSAEISSVTGWMNARAFGFGEGEGCLVSAPASTTLTHSEEAPGQPARSAGEDPGGCTSLIEKRLDLTLLFMHKPLGVALVTAD